MEKGVGVSEGLQILNIVCDLLDPKTLTDFMKTQDGKVLRMVTARLRDQNVTTAEVQ